MFGIRAKYAKEKTKKQEVHVYVYVRMYVYHNIHTQKLIYRSRHAEK